MTVVGWIVWSLVLILCIAQILLSFHRDRGVGTLAGRFAALLAIGLIGTLFTGFSKLHLLWWVPLAHFLNMFVYTAVFRSRVDKAVKQILEEHESEDSE